MLKDVAQEAHRKTGKASQVPARMAGDREVAQEAHRTAGMSSRIHREGEAAGMVGAGCVGELRDERQDGVAHG